MKHEGLRDFATLEELAIQLRKSYQDANYIGNLSSKEALYCGHYLDIVEHAIADIKRQPLGDKREDIDYCLRLLVLAEKKMDQKNKNT